MMTFLEIFGGVVLVVLSFLGLAYTLVMVVARTDTQAELRGCIRDGHREDARALLLVYPTRFTQDQRRNAELWLARKDGLLE